MYNVYNTLIRLSIIINIHVYFWLVEVDFVLHVFNY